MIRPFAAATLSGLLLGITTIGHGPTYHLHWGIFIGFIPLWAGWQSERSAKLIFLSGWVAQFTFSLVAFHWLAYTINEFSHLGTPISLLVLLLYCAVANLQFPLAGVIWHTIFRTRLPNWASIFSLAILTAILQRLGTTIFHWNFGYAWLYMGWPAMQLADIFGFKFLCTISILTNALFLLSWTKRKSSSTLYPALAALLAFIGLNTLGSLRVKSLPLPDRAISVLAIQPNIGNKEKERLEFGEESFRVEILKKYFQYTKSALNAEKARPAFAIWPENAFPSIIGERDLSVGLAPRLRDFLRENRLALLTGGFGLDAQDRITNSLFPIGSDGRWVSRPYDKMILLPFGEYVPGASKFPILKKWFPDVRDYGWGTSPLLLEMPDGEGGMIKIGPQICYEGLFDFISRDIALLGAQIIVNITNDSWYGDWMEPWQHFYITMAKAIETRRPILRVTNTGLSGLILADGSIDEISPISELWFKNYRVPYYSEPPKTFFLERGYYIDWAFLLGCLMLLLLFRKRKIRHTDKAENQ